MRFLNGREMLDYIQNVGDLYSKKANTYLFCYNDAGSICAYSVDSDMANELAHKSYESGEYWGAFLGFGGCIYDDPSYEGFNPETDVSNLNICEFLIIYDDWIDTESYKFHTNKFFIQFPNGYRLVAKQNQDPNYSNEIIIGIVDSNGMWHQDLAIVRGSCRYGDDCKAIPNGEEFEVLVYADEHYEDYTNHFKIGLYHDDEV